jgi:hypothetical protein
VEYDATQDLGYDLQQNLQPAISAVRTDITTVQADQQNLSAAGLPQPPGASTITNTARAAIGHAVTVANGDIAAVNADISQAYALAQGMATGSCAGQGPGPTPQPIAPFS